MTRSNPPRIVACFGALSVAVVAAARFAAGPAPATAAVQPAVYVAVERVGLALNETLGPYLVRAASDTSEVLKAALRRGVAQLAAGEGRAARRIFEEAAEQAPGFADWAYLLAAEAAAMSGDTAGVRTLLDATEPALARDRGWRAWAVARRAAGDGIGAAAGAAAAATMIADAAIRADAFHTAARYALAHGDTALAAIQLRQSIDAAPGSGHAIDAARALSDLRHATAADHRAIGLLYLRHGNVERGAGGVDRYIESGGVTPAERVELQLEVARALFRASRHLEAERRLRPIVALDVATVAAAEAMLLQGRAQYRQGRIEEARATLIRTGERFPVHRAAAEAHFILADLDHDAGDVKNALAHYGHAVAADPASAEAAEAAIRYAALALSTNDAARAIAVLEPVRAAQDAGDRGARIAYHEARVRLAAGERTTAAELLRETRSLAPVSYYAARADELLEDIGWLASLPAGPRRTEESELAAAGALRRIDLLRAITLDSAADFEMERLKRHFANDPLPLYSLAEALHARGETYAGIMLGRDVQRSVRTWNERLLRIIYPFPYRDQIVAEAKRHGLDPHFVAGLIRQESMFQPAVRSSAGAIGLMQLMPATARAVARSEKIAAPNTTKLRDPKLNLRLGMRYLADMLTRYDGRVDYALAAYNAGPTRVARWRNLPEARDPDLFAERIPFAETREYVRVVQQNARIYSALYGQ